MEKIMYTSSETGAYIKMVEFTESHLTYSDFEDYESVKVREMRVVAKSGEWLKIFRQSRVVMGKGRAAQVQELFSQAKVWLGSYSYNARFPPKEFGCNRMGGHTCPLMSAGTDGRAKCTISPYWWGYGGGTDRDVPEDRKCDLFLKMGTESRRSFEYSIPGHPLLMRELWECISGNALVRLERSKPND